MLVSPLMQRLNNFLIGGSSRNVYTAVTLEAARKGTRMRREAIKRAAKRSVIKQEVIPHHKRIEMEKLGNKISPRKSDSGRGAPFDDVYFRKYYQWKVHTFAEAVQLHRETHHPTQLNNPNGACIAHIELSMTSNKKNKFIDAFTNVIVLPHPFDTNQVRSVLAICKDEEMTAMANDLNVTMAFGPEAIKMAMAGDINFNDYDHVVCHSSLLPDMITIHGQMKKKFPSIKNGTAGIDMKAIIDRFMNGIKYEVIKDKYDHDFAKIDVKIGKLEMKDEELEENFKAILLDVETHQLKKSDKLITLVNLMGESSREVFKIDHNIYFPKTEDEDAGDDEKELESAN